MWRFAHFFTKSFCPPPPHFVHHFCELAQLTLYVLGGCMYYTRGGAGGVEEVREEKSTRTGPIVGHFSQHVEPGAGELRNQADLILNCRVI